MARFGKNSSSTRGTNRCRSQNKTSSKDETKTSRIGAGAATERSASKQKTKTLSRNQTTNMERSNQEYSNLCITYARTRKNRTRINASSLICKTQIHDPKWRDETNKQTHRKQKKGTNGTTDNNIMATKISTKTCHDASTGRMEHPPPTYDCDAKRNPTTGNMEQAQRIDSKEGHGTIRNKERLIPGPLTHEHWAPSRKITETHPQEHRNRGNIAKIPNMWKIPETQPQG